MKNAEQNIFPITIEDNGNPSITHLGLTKREYFSGLAMQGLLSLYDASNGLVPNLENIKYMANLSVLASDELLKQLEK